MARRNKAAKRDIQPDPIYRSRLVTQMVNRLMLDGKKSTAEKIMYDAMTLLRERTGNDPAGVLEGSGRERTARARSAVAPRGRCQLPGAGRSAHSPFVHAWRSVGSSRTAGRVASTAWPSGWPASSWTGTTVPA